MFERLEQIAARYEELGQQLAEPTITSDQQRYQKVAKQHRDLESLVDGFHRYRAITDGIAEARLMLTDADPDMRAMAEEELAQLEGKLPAVEEALKLLLLPKDPNDEKNVVVEIRAATGGDEASLFAAEVYRMYTRFAELHRWKVEILSSSESSVGGLKEVSFLIEGDKVYSQLKYESGVHRVQRVPATETQGRVHTSAITVAVLPEAEEVDVKI